jgi:hypothetical protein
MPMTPRGSPRRPRRRGSSSQRHDGRLAALEAEALLADVARVQEALEDLGLVQRLEDAALLLDVDTG